MSHVPETDLVLYAVQPDALSLERQREIENHLGACAECQESSDFFRIREDDLGANLGEPDTWEPQVGNATYESLMAQAELVAEEDREAEVLLKEFLESPANAAWEALGRRRRFRTGGVVRKLNAAAHDVCEHDALAALTFADAAISIAETLPGDLYPANAVYRLLGTAWKERANAQMRLGQFPQALESLERAGRAYSKTPYHTLGLAIVAFVRAGVLYEQQRLDDALVEAERAEREFAHSGDDKRRMDAVFLRGSILYEAGRPTAAVPLFQQIIDYGEQQESPLLIARGSYALGNCQIDLRNLSEASLLFHQAFLIFRDSGPEPERVATEWGIARVIMHSGKLPEAVRRLRDVAANFERYGLVTHAALAGLDMAEGLLAIGRPQEIVQLAQHLFQVFQDAGMLTGALSAIAYLKEAATSGYLNPLALQELRSFIRRVERQPHLQFVPPATS